jgi:ATP-dependent DNA ligase
MIDEWRPMAYGPIEAKKIKDPLCEPLWSGRRVLADLAGGDVRIRTEVGDTLTGYEPLRAAIVESAAAFELVIDGYLLPAPLRDTVGAEALLGDDSGTTAKQIGRQLIFGSRQNARRDAQEMEEERAIMPAPTAPAALVAVDLLWLDRESLLDVPLLERKRLLDSVLLEHELVRRSVIVRPPVEAWFGQWRALGFREFAIKAANSHYRPGTVAQHWATQIIPRR